MLAYLSTIGRVAQMLLTQSSQDNCLFFTALSKSNPISYPNPTPITYNHIPSAITKKLKFSSFPQVWPAFKKDNSTF